MMQEGRSTFDPFGTHAPQTLPSQYQEATPASNRYQEATPASNPFSSQYRATPASNPFASQYSAAPASGGAHGAQSGAGGQFVGGQPQFGGGFDGSQALKPNPNQHSIFRSGVLGKVEKDSFVNVWELIFLPWMLLCLVLIASLHQGDSSSLLVVPFLLIAADCSFMSWRFKKGHTPEVVLGLLCLVAIIAGVVVGFYVNSTSLSEYWRLGRGASYFNVYPAESAASYQDATTITFSLDAAVDSGRTYGFVDGRTEASPIYCVAPVASGATSLVSNRVQYWAAGVGCCYPRTDFICGDAKNTQARGAIVLPESKQHNEMFKAAVMGAQYAYGIAPADKYILVEWKDDPVKFQANLWSKAKKVFFIFGGVYLVISILVGIVLVNVLKQ